jgi:hypothetical protein
MKKSITLLFLCCNLSVFCQGKWGAFTGLNYSYFTDGIFGQVLAEESFGLQLGLVYEKELAAKVHFRPKLVFSQQGDRTKSESVNIFDPIVGGDFELNQIDTKLTYINLPLDFKFWNKIYVIAGPQLGFLVQETQINQFNQKAKSSVDFGLNLGGGFTVNKLFFEVGIYQGFTELYRYNYFYTGNSVKAHNGYAKFTVGYMFK